MLVLLCHGCGLCLQAVSGPPGQVLDFSVSLSSPVKIFNKSFVVICHTRTVCLHPWALVFIHKTPKTEKSFAFSVEPGFRGLRFHWAADFPWCVCVSPSGFILGEESQKMERCVFQLGRLTGKFCRFICLYRSSGIIGLGHHSCLFTLVLED